MAGGLLAASITFRDGLTHKPMFFHILLPQLKTL
jgi:hypothetical protein